VLIALRHIMLGGLTVGSIKVTGLDAAIGRAVEREIGDDGGAGPWGEEVYFRVGMELLNAVAEVTGRYEFKPDPVHVAWPCRQAPYRLAPKAGSGVAADTVGCPHRHRRRGGVLHRHYAAGASTQEDEHAPFRKRPCEPGIDGPAELGQNIHDRPDNLQDGA
jgi:hypothetical protein